MGKQHLDTKNLLCPMPALLTAKHVKRLAPGESLVVEATDPMAEVDIGVLALEEGLELARETRGEVLVFTLTRPETP